jgi:hypothetical protein
VVEDAVLTEMLQASVGLWGWQHPDLPEDPALLREDGSAILGSACREKFGFLEVTCREFVSLGATIPEIVANLRPSHPVEDYEELKALLLAGRVEDSERPFVEGFVAFLEREAARVHSEAMVLRDTGHVWKAMKAVEPFARATPAFPNAASIAALLSELEGMPNYKEELAGGAAYSEAERLEGGLALDAYEAYMAIVEESAGTRIAGNARAQAERILSEGQIGYLESCDDCWSAKRACAKHRIDP